MALEKRYGHYYMYNRPFKDKKIGLKLDARTKSDAKHIEVMILKACRTGKYESLDLDSREACVRMFENQGWQLPDGLRGDIVPRKELTLWEAWELFWKSPEIKASPGRWRYECAVLHLVEKLGKDRPVRSIWVPDLKAYQMERRSEGAAPATVNRELSSLSRLFGVLIDHRLVESNPVKLVKRLSEKSGERQAYLSFKDIQAIIDKCPEWFRPIVLTAYYTGMRRGEILGLTRKQVNLSSRIITLYPVSSDKGGDKEAHWKRIPIHRELVPILQDCLKVTFLETGKVFLIKDLAGIRPPSEESLKNPWRKAVEAIGLIDPRPCLNDLRHTFKSNALSSGIDPEIRESIMGHWFKAKTVMERYGRIKDDLLVKAIDSMTFDHGETEIIVACG